MKIPRPLQRLRHRRAATANGAWLVAYCNEIERQHGREQVIELAALEQEGNRPLPGGNVSTGLRLVPARARRTLRGELVGSDAAPPSPGELV